MNNQNCNNLDDARQQERDLSAEDYIQSYMHNEYMEDLHFVFKLDYESAGRYRPWLNCNNADDAKTKSNIRAATDPLRHFVFSSIFLYHLITHITMWDDMSHDDYKAPDEDPYNETLEYDDFKEFHDDLGWPDFGLDIWKEFSAKYSHEKLFPEGVKMIMERYGLMTTFLNDSLHRYLLASMFKAMHQILFDKLMDLDVSMDVTDRIAETVDENFKRFLTILFNR